MARNSIKPNLQAGPFRWFCRAEIKQQCSKSVLATAAILSLAMQDEHDLDITIQWAKALDDETVTWDDFLASRHKVKRAREKALHELLGEAFERKIEESSKGSSGSSQARS